MPMLALDVQSHRVDLERIVERLEQPFADGLRVGLRAVDQHRELVASDPREHGPVAHRLAQPERDPLQRQVPQFVAEGVVDRLEVVQVEQHHRQRAMFALGRVHHLLERL